MGLLSSWPIDGEVEASVRPPLIAATVVPPDGETLDVIVAHAPPPTMGILRTGPRFDPTNRDIGLRQLWERVDASIDAGRGVVLIGDLNVTDRELGYTDIAEGLADSYLMAGSGWGHTWRPPRFAALPFGLLRIDMALSGRASRRSRVSPTARHAGPTTASSMSRTCARNDDRRGRHARLRPGLSIT
jgi:endonuclease/exonuclease/phosphatase family metal-dependent hydrolase